MKFSMKTLALTLGLLAKMNTFANAENKEKKVTIKKAAKTEISELKKSGEWPKGASASTIAYLTSIGQWPLKTSGSNTVALSGTLPPNDSCASATEITSFPFASSGDTSDASIETGYALNECGGVDYNDSPAVWYKVTGTGEEMVVKTIVPYGFDTKLHIYSGSCGSFTCVGGNNDGVDLSLSRVRWNSVAEVEYFIVVHGYAGGDYGEYNLRVTSGSSPPVNDLCASATEITYLPFSSSGDTTFASTENGVALDVCGIDSGLMGIPSPVKYYLGSPAVWYKVSGTGGQMSAETLIPFDYDTQLHVYSGSCGSFTCITGNDDKNYDSNRPPISSRLSKVTWESVPCQDYYILMHGWDSDYGSYNLEVSSATAVQDCSEAPSMVPSDIPSSLPSSEPSWLDDEQCKKRDPENDICAELDGRCKLDCEDDEDFVCVPGLCSYDRNWDKPTKSPKTRALMDEVDVVDIEVTADGTVERKLKATKAPSTKETKAPKATKAPKSSCACRVPRKRGCKN